ncbi:hypothetical protein H4Q26_008062 [Puccinia striiformis f. sp. tritici PST-130]|nr:hypothetical protein H4Q26_008062 [Puccinia striiformis f. sp. tritici PST-130]
MVGWRKSSDKFQLMGRYRDQEAIDAAPEEYDCLMQNASPQASDILGEMFKDFANVVFEENRKKMLQDNIPAMAALEFNVPLNENDCAPNLSFTRDGGAFVLPNQRCGIDFSKQNGLVKMIWRANQYPHCTLPAVNHGCHTRIGISLQVSKKTASASREITNGEIMNRTTNRDKKPEDIYGYASKSVDLLQSLKLPDSHTTPSNGENISPLSTVTDDLNTLVTS